MIVLDFIGGVLTIVIAGWLGWASRALDQHGRVLAVIANEVKPDNAPSLREVVSRHTAQLAVNSERITRLERANQ